MKSSRRSFLAGILALVATPALARVAPVLPTAAMRDAAINELLSRRIAEAHRIMAKNLAESLFSNYTPAIGGLSYLLEHDDDDDGVRLEHVEIVKPVNLTYSHG